MRSGTLRHYVELQKRSHTKGAHGTATEVWTTFRETYASIEPLGGRELLDARQVDARISHRIRLRYVEGFNAIGRILGAGGRIFNVSAVLNKDERNHELEVLAEEEVSP